MFGGDRRGEIIGKKSPPCSGREKLGYFAVSDPHVLEGLNLSMVFNV